MLLFELISKLQLAYHFAFAQDIILPLLFIKNVFAYICVVLTDSLQMLQYI